MVEDTYEGDIDGEVESGGGSVELEVAIRTARR